MNPRAVKKDSDKFIASNPFEDFNSGLTGNDDKIVAGKRVPPKKDSEAMGKSLSTEDNPFENFNNQLKKKDIGGPGGSELDPVVSQEASISSSNAGDLSKFTEERDNAFSFFRDDVKKTMDGQAAKSIYPAVMGPDGQPLPNPAQDPNSGVMPDDIRIMNNPDDMKEYLDKRSNEISENIKRLAAERDQKYTRTMMVAGKENNNFQPTVQEVTDRGNYDRMTGEIKNMTDYLKNLQKSAVEVVSDQLIKKTIAKNPKGSIGVPRELGRDIVRYADKKTNDQLSALEESGRALGSVPSADLERIGLQAWKRYLLTNPDAPLRDQRIQALNDWEADYDERNFELTGARVRHKIGAQLQKESGFLSSIFRRQPSEAQMIEAAKKAGLTDSEMKVFNTYVLPTEKRNIGTDIPMSGFFNKFGEAVVSNTENLGNIFRSDTDRLFDSMNQETNTRYDEVGEFQRDKAEMLDLEKKAKIKQGITKPEQERLNELKNYNDVRRWYEKFWDGTGDLTGQVAYQAGLARMFGAAGNMATKAPVVGNLIARGTTMAGGADAINLMVTSFLTSYDSHAKEAVSLMPRKDQALQRRLYAYTMSGVEGLSERIFPDTKVLDAFKRTVSPEVIKLTGRLAANEISEEAAKSRLQQIITNKLKPFAKEFVKGEVQEGAEEATVDIATGIAETIFAGKDFDAEETFGNAANTFLTTMAYSPIVAGLAAAKDVRSGAYGKSGLYKMATDPETFRREIYRQQAEGSLSQPEADQKLKILNTAAKIAEELPVKKSLDPKKNAELTALNNQWRDNIKAIGERTDISDEEKETLKQQEDDRSSKEIADYVSKQNTINNAAMDYPDRASYLTHRLNEVLLDEQIANTSDEVVKADLVKQKERSQKIREGIFKGDIIVGNNLEEIATTPVVAQELGITSLDEVSEDALPNNITKPKKQDDEKQGSTSQRQQDGEKGGSGQNIGQENNAAEQIVPTTEEVVNRPTVLQGGREVPLPAGLTESQFRKLPKRVQDRLIQQEEQQQGVNYGYAEVKPGQDVAVGEDIGRDFDETRVGEEISRDFDETRIGEDIGRDFDETRVGEETSRDFDESGIPATGNLPTMSEQEANDFVGELVAAEDIAPGYRQMATDNPREFLRFVAQQANNLDLNGQPNENFNTRQGAIDSFGQPLIDAANEQFPEYVQTAQRSTASNTNNSFFEPIANINTDVSRFQPRENEFSQESVNRIVENFDDNRMDPVVTYNDPVTGQQIVLSGHSRLEAHRVLDQLPDSDPRKQRAIENGYRPGQIKVRSFTGTEQQAREFAERSNDLATRNTDSESAASLRRAREAGDSRRAIQERAKTDFGRNWRYLYNMSFLNPNGKALQTLKQFEGNPDKTLQSQIEKNIQWIGAARERLGDLLTDAHENEMFDFLMDKNRSTKLDRENDFVGLIQNIAGRFDHNPNEPLNLNRIRNRSTAEVNYDNEEAEIKQNIREKQAEVDAINDRLNNPQNPAYVNPSAADYKDVVRVAEQRKTLANQQLALLRKELLEHQQNKGKAISTGMAQPSLFDMNNLTPAEQQELNTELSEDGITVENINNYENDVQDIPDTEAVQETDNSNAEETANVPEAIREPANDQGGSTQQDQSSPAVQGQTGSSPALAMNPEQRAEYERARNLVPQITMDYKLLDESKEVWRASSDNSVLISDIEDGKWPNGQKIKPKEMAALFERLKYNNDVLAAALQRGLPEITPTIKKLANDLARRLGNGPVALNYENPNEWIWFNDIGIKPGDSNAAILDKLIAANSPFTPIFEAAKRDPKFAQVNFELIDDRQGGEGGMSGLYWPLTHPENPGRLQIWNKGNVLYSAAHELMHFITLDGSRLDQLVGTPSYNAIKNFYNHITKQRIPPSLIQGANRQNYGLTDVKEFMAEILINPAFRDYVSDIYANSYQDIAKPGKSFGDMIADFFRDLLNKIFGGQQQAENIGYNPEQPVIENAARIMRDLFLGETPTSETPVVGMNQNRSMRPAALEALALPSLAEKDQSTVISDFVAEMKEEGYTNDQLKKALQLNGISQEEAEAYVDRNENPRQKGKDIGVEEKQRRLADAKQAFRDALRKQRGQINMGLPIDPEVIANGVKLVAAYVDMGITKFREILSDIASSFPEFTDRANMNALRGVYSYYRSNLPPVERVFFDDDNTIDQILDDAELNPILNNQNDGTGTTVDMATNSPRGAATDPVGEGFLSPYREGSDTEAGAASGDVIEPIQPTDSPGLLPFDAPTVRETGDSGLPFEERPATANTGNAGDPDSGRGNPIDESGIPPYTGSGGSTERDAESITGPTITEKIAAQRAAESIPVIPGDLANIRATLPFLTPAQQEDVFKAETRFIGDGPDEDKLYGKGILFTNGTGTGKTLTGLGIAKRMFRQGRRNGLIVVPSDVKAKDWISEANEFLGLDVHQLENTTDPGAQDSANITTYANFRENIPIQNREWDYVIYDESHKINSNGEGSTTSGDLAHNKATLSPREARNKAKQVIRYDERMSAISERNSRAIANGQPADYEAVKILDEELKNETVRQFKKTNVVFLSATPFAYHPNLVYADGYLFKIREEFQPSNNTYGYNQPNAYNNFFIQNFGYRMRYNKLTRPESGVDVDLLERQFTENLKKAGTVVSRKLIVDKDYSREFVRVENQLGNRIDEGMSIMGDYDLFPTLSQNMHRHFTFLYKNQLMEAIKAKWAVERIRQHLGLGRKVVVSHSYNENQPLHPFRFDAADILSPLSRDYERLRDDLDRFREEYPEYYNLNMGELKSPILTLTEAFPDQVALFNGTISKTKRNEAKRKFNQDNSGIDIFLVQMDAGKEGISLHDTTGVRQRALLNLGLPYKPTDAIQIEGRIYRLGQKSDAVIEYPILNLNFEAFAYADKINQRVRTAENLALGDEARNLELSFKEGYINANESAPSINQGKGGKEDDSRMEAANEFQKSKTFYYKRGKRTSRDKAGVTGDYYATPEPLGMKMVEWGGLVPNEKAAEPSAGHGAISRFFPRNTRNLFIEPNADLRAEAGLVSFGEMRAGTFEDLNIVNKYDVIVMNPPFGQAGKTAMDHLLKAMRHLNDGGRIVALVPTGKMNDRIANWLDSDDAKGFHIRARILLPGVTFERAGTQVSTQILIIDKLEDETIQVPPQRTIDLTDYGKISDFFDAIEDLSLPARINPGQFAEEQNSGESDNAQTPATASTPATQGVNGSAASGISDLAEVTKNFHQKKQRDNWVVALKKKVSENDFSLMRTTAKDLGGYWSSYKGDGAIPGFQFDNEKAANDMYAAITGQNMPQPERMSLADRIRTWKLGKQGGMLYSTIIPGGPQIWNAAVEIAARAVEAGEALADAMARAKNYIEQNWKKSWQKARFNQEMLMELKGRGVLSYNLTDTQRAEGDAAIARIQRTGKLIKEINELRQAFDIARAALTDPDDIRELEESYNEFERYIFDGLSAQEAEKNTQFSLDLDDQTWWQKQKENWQNRYQRLEQVQKEIEAAGITIEEKNDMVNRADRWKSIAEAKIDKVLREVGLSDVDIFVWKGRQKLDDSLFDRMNQAGVDYRKFNLYMYAKHAPERNAHNAKLRRENFAKKVAQIENDIQKYKDQYAATPSSQLQGMITRKENELAAYVAYQDAVDGNQNKNYIKLLEKKIDYRYRLMDDGGSGMTNAQADEILQEVVKEGSLPKFEAFEKEIREKVIEKSLQLQKDYGLIDQENYDYLSTYYQNYVPLRVDDSFFQNGQAYSETAIPGAKIYKSKGASNYTFENRNNPVTQAVIDLQATIYEGEQNEYKKVISEAIKSAPDPDVWELRSALYAPVKDKTGKVVGLDEIEIPRNGIPFFENGQKKYLVINDKALYDALQGNNVKAAIPILAKINGIFRSLFTLYNPAFTVTNLIRDLQTAGVVLSAAQKGEAAANFRANLPKIFSILKGSYKQQGGADTAYWEQIAQQYRDGGGEMSWFGQGETAEQIKNIEEAYKNYQKSGVFDAGKNLGIALADFINKANQAVENSTRLAIYDAMLKSGVENYKAIEVARNATINFSKKGNYGPMADSLYLFFNASVQGTTNVMKTMLTTRKGLMLAGGIVLAGLLTTIYNNAMSDCENAEDPANCYDNIPDYEKERNIIIKNPLGKGFFKIPLAWGFNVFYNMGEQLAQGIAGKTDVTDATVYTLKSAFNSFNPTGSVDQPVLQHISPTVTDPVVQYFTNRDGFGRPIYADNPYDRRPDSQRSFPSDSKGAVNFAEWLNKQTGGNEKIKGKIDVSPGTLDWLFETFTGGLGQFTSQTIGSTRDAIDPKQEVEIRKVPILNRFFTAPKERADKKSIFQMLDDSYNSIMSDREIEKFHTELEKAVRLGQMQEEKAEGYQRRFDKNQYELNNQEFFSFIDRTKDEKVSAREIAGFVKALEQRAKRKEIPADWVKTYKAEITRNQRKFKE